MGQEEGDGPRFGDNARVEGDVFTGGKHEYHYETVYNTVLRGPDELPTRYDGRVQSFLEYYLGTADRPVPFGGRAASLAALDGWLAEAGAPPYALLAAPAGRGKSGLLAHWVARLSEREGGPHLVYFPISIRFQTNTESVVFASLAARLAHLHGEKVSPLVDAQQYRGLFADYLRRPAPDGGRVLVVIDGLDEAGGWEAGADLFPIAPPPHLRVVAAARLMADDLDGSAWLAQLGWEQPGLARRMPLEALDRAGVADVLDQLTAALGEQAKSQDLIDRLYTLSEGDPLLVRLYVGALLPQGGQPAAFKPSDLDHLAPGLKAFLKQWMKEQMSLWGSADPTESATVQGVLDACAMALGPLRRDDLLALDKTLFPSGRAITRALRPLSRLIIGDADSGYVFSHPRLDEYFVDEMAKDERAAWDRKFLDYGARTLKALADGRLAPGAASPYLLQHYGAHLEQAHSPSADIYALLAQSWLRAHESVLGTPAGFLDDARRVARRARADGPAALGQQVRAALSFASIAAIGSNIAPDLLEACARAGVISPAAALVLARQKASLRDRVRCLTALAPLLPAAHQAAVLEEAFQAAELIDGWDRAEALQTIAGALPEPALARLADRLLEAARTWEGVAMRAVPLAQIASALPDSEAVPILAEALGIARAEPDASSRATQLLAVAKALPEGERVVIAREAWEAARLVDGDAYRAELLGQAAEYLPEAERVAAMTEAFEAINAGPLDNEAAIAMIELVDRLPAGLREQAQASLIEEYHRGAGQPRRRIKAGEAAELANAHSAWASLLARYAFFLPETDVRAALAQAWTIKETAVQLRALTAVATRLSHEERLEVMARAISYAGLSEMGDPDSRALNDMAAHMPPELVPDAATAVRSVLSLREQAFILARLAQRLPPEQRTPLLTEAMAAARAIEDQTARVDLVSSLAGRLDGIQRDSLLEDAWKIIKTIPHAVQRLNQFGPLARHRPPEAVQAEMLSSLRQTRDQISAKVTLAEIAPYLTESLLPEAIDITRNLGLGAAAVMVRLKLAGRLTGEPALALYREALAAAEATEHANGLVDSLIQVLLAAPDELRPEALAKAQAAALKGQYGSQRVNWLAVIGPLAGGLQQRQLLAAALSTTADLQDEIERGRALETLALVLPEDFLAAALEVAAGIKFDFVRSSAVAALNKASGAREAEAGAVPPPGVPVPVRDDEAARWLAGIRGRPSSKERIEALTEVIERLPDNALAETLRLLCTCADRRESLPLLQQLVARWDALSGVSGFEGLTSCLSAYGETPRPQLLAAIQLLAPVLQTVGGESAIIAAAEAVLEAGEWWE